MRVDWKVSSVMWALEEVCDRIMEIHIMRGVVIYSPHHNHSCDQTSESEMKRSCGTLYAFFWVIPRLLNFIF